MDFSEKVVVITGGNSGIGKSTAIEFAKKKASVVIIGKDRDKLLKTLEELKRYNEKCGSVVCDIRDRINIKSCINMILGKYGSVDILINNAGIAMYEEFDKEIPENITNMVNTNFLGTIYFCKYVIPIMKEQKSGHIINVSSIAGKIGFPNVAVYAATKGAIYSFTEVLYYELKNHGIKVSVICPGATKTNLFDHESWKKFPHEKRHKHAQEPIEVAREIIKCAENYKFEVIVPHHYIWKIKALHLFRDAIMKKIEKLPK
ncbi:SDR family oxidoreductase [Candidatus Woesearchaeota archaeon]|nr:SDR family oxidoreductase [Candidatus Woesearchaeota archaeon]